MSITHFEYPTSIIFGPGAVGELASRLSQAHGGESLLLVTDPGLVDIGMCREIVDHLLTWGLHVTPFSDVHGNPTEIDILSGVNAYRAIDARGIIALGGGSPMDAAKAIAVLVDHDEPLAHFDERTGGAARIRGPLAPIYAIPTTAGTGSEVNCSAVIIAADTGTKIAIRHPMLMPRIATLDAELCVGLPPHLTANTGMDAMTRGLEAYLAAAFDPMADAMALGCIEMVVQHLPRAVAEGSDLDARGNMLLAASMGAMAAPKGQGMIRAMAHPLATRYDLHQGMALSAIAPAVLRYQLTHKAEHFTDELEARYTRVARLLSADAAADLPDALATFITSIGVENNLAEIGLVDADIPSLATEAHADSCHQQNPIPLALDDFAAAYRVH